MWKDGLRNVPTFGHRMGNKINEDASSITQRMHSSSIGNYTPRRYNELSNIAKKFKDTGFVLNDDTIYNNRIISKNLNNDNKEIF